MPPALTDLVSMADRAGIITDFDGTLSAIVEDPAEARALEGTAALLAGLARRYRRVAVVSGRPVAFLVDRLGLDHLSPGAPSLEDQDKRIAVFGLYGLEWAGADGVVHTRADAEGWRSAVNQAGEQARDEVGAGVMVEPKGLSLTIHWRTVPDQEQPAQLLARRLAKDWDLVSHGGRRSVELRPPVEADKGTAVTSLCEGLAAACFVGDDRGDLPAFAALDRLAASRGLCTLKVGVSSSEAPPELLAEADLVVEGPEGALAMLASLA